MLDFWRFAAFFAFIAVIAVVMAFCFRERRLWHDGKTSSDLRGTRAAERGSDRRIAAVTFSAVIVGALLALPVG